MRSIATLAALLLTIPAFAQISTGDPDSDHNATDWRSPRYVAPKQVEVWALVIVWRWPEYQVDTYPIFRSKAECLALLDNWDSDKVSATASCVML